jgi:hypothetical protein
MTKTLLSLAFGLILHVSATAQCLDGDCQNGRGMYQFENGNKYNGEFKRGIMHGTGAAVFANGNKYNGEWREGMREGVGVYYFLSGNVYTGSFRKNKFDGKGTKMTNLMAKAFTHSLRATATKGHLLMANSVVLAKCFPKMVKNMSATGAIMFGMAMAKSFGQMEQSLKVFGKMAK